jgi:glycosyltransferase involved in cell wall biosynthesis
VTTHSAFPPTPGTDLILCLSHLRWDLVWQRPQHLMSRAAATRSVAYLEEPVDAEGTLPRLQERRDPSGVVVLTPQVPRGADSTTETRRLIGRWLARRGHRRLILWFQTPMAVDIARHLPADAWVYDCMDELSAFDFAPAGLRDREEALMTRADVVFAGGRSLHAARVLRRPDAHLMPSSVDVAHFGAARAGRPDPADQAGIPRPRVGFFGVIDERMDLSLVAATAERMPEVAFVMLGPVVKIDPARLPRLPNVYWLGSKTYASLPDYLANWDAGWMPFALNRSTQFISPTKTPEFLAAGLPVTSTAVPDVVHDYGGKGLVRIADAATMPEALAESLKAPPPDWLPRVDAMLARTSWDATWARMDAAITAAMTRPAAVATAKGSEVRHDV